MHPFQSILVRWFLECWRSLLPSPVWPLPICLDSWTWHSRFLCNIALNSIRLASITSHIHNWVLFLLWLHPFILSEVISPLISSSILGTYWPGEFLFQYPIILPFHTVLGVLKARILKWFAIPFTSGPHSVRPLHHDPPVLGCPAGMAWFHWVRQGCGPSVIRLTSFLKSYSHFPIGEGNGNTLQYSCLGYPMDRGAWWATVHEVTKSWTWLRDWAQNIILAKPLKHQEINFIKHMTLLWGNI